MIFEILVQYLCVEHIEYAVLIGLQGLRIVDVFMCKSKLHYLFLMGFVAIVVAYTMTFVDFYISGHEKNLSIYPLVLKMIVFFKGLPDMYYDLF